MRNLTFCAIGIFVSISAAANIFDTENHRLDLFDYKHYTVSALNNPFKAIGEYGLAQIETQSDGYLLYGSENQIIKFDKNREIVWIKKIPSELGMMRTFSDGSILLALSVSINEPRVRYVPYQLLDRDGNPLTGKVYWIDPTQMTSFRVISLTTDGDSVFYSGVASKNTSSSSEWKYTIWKCNHSLDTIWTKQIDVSDISFIKKCKTGNILIGAIDGVRPMNILLDAQGNVIWSFTLDTPSIEGKWTDGIELEDGSFIVAGFSDCMITAHISNDGRLINFKKNQQLNIKGADYHKTYGKLMNLHDNSICYYTGSIVEFDHTLSKFHTSEMFINAIDRSDLAYISPITFFRKINSDSLLSLARYYDHLATACVGSNLPPQIVWNHPTVNIRPGHVYIDTIKNIDNFPGDTVRYTFVNQQNAPIIFDTLSGIISCVPFSKDTGNYSIEIVARDERFQADTVQFTLVIGTDAVKTVRPKDLYSLSPTTNPTMFIHFKQEIKTKQAIDLLGREIRSIPGQAYRAKVASGVFVNKR